MFGFGRGPAVRLRAQQIGLVLSTIKQLLSDKPFDQRCESLKQQGFIGDLHPASPHDPSGRQEFSFVESSPSLQDFRYSLFSSASPVLFAAEGLTDFFGASATIVSEGAKISVFTSRSVAFPMGRDAKALVKELGRIPGFTDITAHMS